MGQQAGALTAMLDQVIWSFVAGSQPGQIVVNRSGRRFVNECIAYGDYGKVVGYFDAHTYDFPNIPSYIISNRPLAPADVNPNRLGSQATAHDAVVSASTLRELAELIGVDAPNLETTVAEFDRNAIEGKVPQFGRGVGAVGIRHRRFDKTYPNPALAPLGSTGPFYAQPVVARCFGTRGGPVIDEKARIINFEGQPIPGVFGAGNAVASPLGLAYPGGGGTLGPAITFGYIAGETLTA